MAIDQTTSSRPTSVATAVNTRSQASGTRNAPQTISAGNATALGLANVQSQAARPNFNLQFNNLQNQIIDRLNQKITEIQQVKTNSGMKTLLQSERQKLVQVAEGVEPVRQSVVTNSYILSTMSDLIGQLNGAVAAADAGDPTEFDRLLAGLNDTSDKIQVTDGSAIGLWVGDGSDKLKRDGLLQTTNPDGTKARAITFSDFASTTDALGAITDAMYHLSNVQNSSQVRADVLAGIMETTSTSIQKIDAQLQIQDTADLVSQAAEITKVKQQYSYMLQSLSLSFEGSQSMADALGAQLLGGASVDRGSVMNLFT